MLVSIGHWFVFFCLRSMLEGGRFMLVDVPEEAILLKYICVVIGRGRWILIWDNINRVGVGVYALDQFME